MAAGDFKGKALEHWLAIRVSGKDESRLEAVDAIRLLCEPEERVLLLVEALGDHCWRVRAAAMRALFEVALPIGTRPLVEAAWGKWERAIDDPSQEVRKVAFGLIATLERGDDVSQKDNAGK
jgi:HEAT repeat protein